MCNEEIRKAAKKNGVKLWEIAEKLGVNDSNFSRKLRRELPEADQERVISIINAIAAAREG